jgi:hypothetical protein
MLTRQDIELIGWKYYIDQPMIDHYKQYMPQGSTEYNSHRWTLGKYILEFKDHPWIDSKEIRVDIFEDTVLGAYGRLFSGFPDSLEELLTTMKLLRIEHARG